MPLLEHPTEIVTCANDARLPDLLCLLGSIRKFAPTASVHIIPFNDNCAMTEEVADAYRARLVERNPVWDDVGQRLYGNEEYRPGVPRWMYFRKLNMFENMVASVRLFLDANSVMLSSKHPNHREADALFHSHAAKGRNFVHDASFEMIPPPNIGNGYNLGHISFTRRTADTIRKFAEIISPDHRRFLGPAPEQAFLCYALSVTGLKSALLCEIDPDIAPSNSSVLPVIQSTSGEYRYSSPPFAGRRLLSLKKSATPGIRNPNSHLFDRFRLNLNDRKLNPND